MQIGFLGHGVFGAAIGSLVEANGHKPDYVDIGDSFRETPEILFIATPVQLLREALLTHKEVFQGTKLVVNLSKGIEKETSYLPHQIVAEVLGERSYVAVAGASFASEIVSKMPTAVSIAGTETEAVGIVKALLTRPFFILEELGTIVELELAAAMKNIYALASGYVAGSGGGKNTHAHVQVVALREYKKLIHALEGKARIVRPGVVGDLILTCGSNDSRNFQYGFACADGVCDTTQTIEGVATAEAILMLAEERKVELPLAKAVLALVNNPTDGDDLLYEALGFLNL